MAKAQNVSGGTVLRGQDGALYFIRDEMLPSLKVEGEGLERIERLLSDSAGGDVSGFDFKASYEREESTVEPLKYVAGDLLQDQPDDREAPNLAPSSTIMCPWFC